MHELGHPRCEREHGTLIVHESIAKGFSGKDGADYASHVALARCMCYVRNGLSKLHKQVTSEVASASCARKIHDSFAKLVAQARYLIRDCLSKFHERFSAVFS